MDLEQLRDNVRAYLRERSREDMSQPELARKIGGVSASWLNKFLNGQFPDLSVRRLNRLAKWVENDRRSAGRADADTTIAAGNWG
jgi:transcriptional regulator with XRE-family HTH domain